MREDLIILVTALTGIASLTSFSAMWISLAKSRTKRPLELAPRQVIRIPIVSDIAAGLGVVVEENIEDYLFLDEDHYNRADFGVRVEGDSMRDAGILRGDIALIRQQPFVETGEIAAIVISTLAGSEGVLKRYNFVHEERPDLVHWLLESSNPSSEHIVVIPRGAAVAAIKALYDEAIRSSRMRVRYYEDAELAIAGKYVGVLRKD
jgi:SOS-response transcriptional repressor LexA